MKVRIGAFPPQSALPARRLLAQRPTLLHVEEAVCATGACSPPIC
jgi:hypothetical protein